jgi:hypothetical protein
LIQHWFEVSFIGSYCRCGPCFNIIRLVTQRSLNVNLNYRCLFITCDYINHIYFFFREEHCIALLVKNVILYKVKRSRHVVLKRSFWVELIKRNCVTNTESFNTNQNASWISRVKITRYNRRSKLDLLYQCSIYLIYE